MKYYIRQLFLLASIAFLFSCGHSKKAQMTFQVAGSAGLKAVIYEQDVAGVNFIDSIEFNKKGELSYKVGIDHPTFYYVKIPGKASISLLLNPKEKVVVSSQLDEFHQKKKISGSESSILLNSLYDSLRSAKAYVKFMQEEFQSTDDIAKREEISSEFQQFIDGYRKYTISFILDNPTSLVAVPAIYQEITPSEIVLNRRRDLQIYKLVSDSLSKYYPEHRYVKTLKANFANLMANEQASELISAADEIIEGLPDLELPNLKGKDVKLSSLKGNTVLLHFWSSADKSSVQMMNAYKQVYENYKHKDFKVYNVCLDKSEDRWRYAVKFEEIEEFVNVCDTAFPNSTTKMFYNISAIPSNYLINYDQTQILAKNIDPNTLNRSLKRILN